MNDSKGTLIRLKDELDSEGRELISYAVIGKLIEKIARLENTIDNFILTAGQMDEFQHLINTRFRKFPKNMFGKQKLRWKKDEGKAEFIADCYILNPKLREVGDLDGLVCINYFLFCLEEIWTARNIIVHSEVRTIRHWDETFYVIGAKYSRIVTENQGENIIEYRQDKFKIGRGYMLKMYRRSDYLENMLQDGIRILQGKNLKGERDMMRREEADGRARMQEFFDAGIRIDYSRSYVFPEEI